MLKKIKAKLLSLNFVVNYRKIIPYIKPYWFRALLAVIITIPIGSADALIAWSLKPYMDVVLLERNITQTWYIPLLIIFFSLLQSLLIYTATYLNTWVGQKIANDMKIIERAVPILEAARDKHQAGKELLNWFLPHASSKR